MDSKYICKWFVISGAIIIWGVKYILRPMDLFDEPMKFFLGIAPNLLGSFLIPFGAYWFFSGKNFLIARLFQFRSAYDLRLVCLLSFCMLVVNEYLQQIPYFGRTFDYYDILFSSAGLAVSYFIFGKIQARKSDEYPVRTY